MSKKRSMEVDEVAVDMNHKRGMFASPDSNKRLRPTENTEYLQAFNSFDKDRSGTIDVFELGACLQAIQQAVETGTIKKMFSHAFAYSTIALLTAKYADENGIQWKQFAKMMQYIETVKKIFQLIDTDGTGDLDVSELSRALYESGFNVTGCPGGADPLSRQVAFEIGTAYDLNGDGKIGFDEFLQMRLEWDYYISAWNSYTDPQSKFMEPGKILECLEEMKTSMEPLAAVAKSEIWTKLGSEVHQSLQQMLRGLFHTSMFNKVHAFDKRTAEMVIKTYGQGTSHLTFEQFCMMMEFLKKQKKDFVAIDTNGDGSLSADEMYQACPNVPREVINEIGNRYDLHRTGKIEFDEFLQMKMELQLK